MKAQSRILGVDDAPFKFTDEHVPVVGVIVRAPSYVEGVLTTRVHIDGTDATEVLAATISRSRYRRGLALVLLDGAALGGFNVVDIDALHESIGVPVATVTRDKPDLDAMERVLRRKFADGERRAEILRRNELIRVETPHKPLYATVAGLPPHELREAIHRCTVRGALPEPVRVAHLIATAIVKGESKGNA
jgi:endonuclease V-like protein UPF0215 family